MTTNEELNCIAMDLAKYCGRWGRFGGQAKEKYGTVRFYAFFTEPSLHTIFYPGYYYTQFKGVLSWFDDKMWTPAMSFLIGKPWGAWQSFIYRRAYAIQLKKYPQHREAILGGASYNELLGNL